MHLALTSMGDPESCCYRQRDAAQSNAKCKLLGELFDRGAANGLPVSNQACLACCQQNPPNAQSLNAVVASLVLEELAIEQQAGRRHQHGDMLEQLAIAALDRPGEQTPPLESLIDHAVTAEVLAKRIEQRQPLLLLRFGDGEWLSMLGADGHNCDGHGFFPYTMGRELRQVLHAAAAESPTRRGLWLGTTCELAREGSAILSSLPSLSTLPWVSDAIFRLGMANLQTRRFVLACQQFAGPKAIVGSALLRPVARALGAHHVIIPLRNCYIQIDEIERQCRSVAPELLLCCASMATECLLWRMRDMSETAMLVDCGSIFDVMLRYPIRTQYYDWSDLIARHYFPIFAPFVRADDMH